ncbi:MAG: glycosyltransferase family 2 protein [Candidatus Electronema sp. V4]|uniref:glycosyltransferase family 2 protein n=1 Tax=Candidatus Electronema sp. V4 TaxID=3454756 RepID=UPI004055403B
MLISVVIPMYNSKYTIIKSIESVLNQSYQGDIEILIVNDGSTDNCGKIVENYISSNNRAIPIRLINKSNGGVSSARNVGIKEAKGDWIALLDSDDIWLPNKLEKQIDAIKLNEDIFFFGAVKDDDIYPFFKKNASGIYTLNCKEILMKWHPHPSTVLFNKKILIQSGLFDETKTHAEDGDLWLRIALYYKIYCLNEKLVCTGVPKRSFGHSGLSSNMPKMYKGEVLIIKNAKKRKQINLLQFIFFYFWLTIKYGRRNMIVFLRK